MPSVLFLVANKTALGAVDQDIYDVLAAASWSITLQSFSLAANSDATGLDVVLVSDQGNSLPISGLFYDQAVPIVCIERGFGDTWNFGTAADRSGSSQTDTAIVDNSHYITDGLSVADLAVASPAVRMNYVTGTGTGAEILSEIVSGDSRAGDASLVVYEQGAAMANGATAPERRVYTWFTGDGNLNAAGEALFRSHCAECHGTYGGTETYPERLVAIEEVGTDRVRLDSLSAADRRALNNSWFGHLGADAADLRDREEPRGYVPPPLDGIWATAPYFHNGSVPTLWHVLHPSERPVVWRRTPTGYDDARVGLEFEEAAELPAARLRPSERRTYFDTRKPGKSAAGHDFADALAEDEKRAVLEYLKTL